MRVDSHIRIIASSRSDYEILVRLYRVTESTDKYVIYNLYYYYICLMYDVYDIIFMVYRHLVVHPSVSEHLLLSVFYCSFFLEYARPSAKKIDFGLEWTF